MKFIKQFMFMLNRFDLNDGNKKKEKRKNIFVLNTKCVFNVMQ